jgi:hypothetical protein
VKGSARFNAGRTGLGGASETLGDGALKGGSFVNKMGPAGGRGERENIFEGERS